MSPIPQILSRAAGLLERDSSSSSSGSSISTIAIVGIVLLVLAIVLTSALVAIFLVRRHRRRQAAMRDSFVPNNFKIVGSLSSVLDSRRASRAASVYKPTDDYGQYRPPLPQQAHHHVRSLSHSQMLRTNPVP